MEHPNTDLANEMRKCVKAVDKTDVDVLAQSGLRKGLLLLDKNTNRYVLTAKGNVFMSKWYNKQHA